MRLAEDLSGARLTVAQWVDRRLRVAILTGELAPGSRIVPGQLASAWSVSGTPVREAIHRLAADGLIEELPHRGARVKRPTREDVLDLYQLRLMLEPHALSLSLAVSDDDHRRRMQEAYDELVLAGEPFETDPVAYEDVHRAFHRTLLDQCGSQRLLGILDTLSQQATYYRMLSAREAMRGGEDVGRREHQELFERCKAGDAEGATAVLRHHLEHTSRAVLAGRAVDSSGRDDESPAGRAGAAG